MEANGNKILWLKKINHEEWHGFVMDSWAYVVEKMEAEDGSWRVVLHRVESGYILVLPEGSKVSDGKRRAAEDLADGLEAAEVVPPSRARFVPLSGPGGCSCGGGCGGK